LRYANNKIDEYHNWNFLRQQIQENELEPLIKRSFLRTLFEHKTALASKKTPSSRSIFALREPMIPHRDRRVKIDRTSRERKSASFSGDVACRRRQEFVSVSGFVTVTPRKSLT
jgi:hypothetical protein